ncbi:pupal cuticle protein-like [Agrilus planipennis]|uniref:Pupal cuticle protein-like n=1 Tax=Agrilus planipennis TaxID=224129 RepID=A0A1W4XG24_AGRPL|nr:pupal cuticle protein-like [Agrilus planipennis]
MLRIFALLLFFVAGYCYGAPDPYYPQPDPYATPPPWRGPIHVPVLRPDGVPREPPEVEAQRQHHLAKVNEAYATAAPKVGVWQGGYNNPAPQSQWNPPAQSQWNPPPSNQWNQNRWNGRLPEFGPNGQVKETPEFEAIKQQHLAEYSRALARSGAPQYY